MNPDAEASPRGAFAPTDAVLLALLPGALAMFVCFGAGVFLNLIWSAPAALLAETLARRAERRPAQAFGADRGRLLLAALLALSLPPACPWWLAVGAAVFAVAVGRRLRRSEGRTLFNPAMLAYAALLLCFPREMSRWPGPEGAGAALPMGPADAVRTALGLGDAGALDGFTMATPLEVLRQDTSHTVAELRAMYPQFGSVAGRGWEWANAGFLVGGLWLVRRGTIDWRAPAGMLLGLSVLALIHDDGSSASGGPVLFHLFGGGTLLAAFFILTEPGSSPRYPRTRFMSGLGVGALAYLMRSQGEWTDGIAFAVLGMNSLTPFVERAWMRGAAHAPAETAARHTPLRHLPDALRVGMLLALLTLDWQGTGGARDLPPSERADALLGELTESGFTAASTFSVQDPALLGLPAPRPAWRLRTASGSTAVVLPLRAHEGYGGPIDLLLAVDERGRVLALRVVVHTESPGFSDPLDAADRAWLRGFEGRRRTDTRWSLRKEGGDIDGFTGATVTPRAIVAAVRSALQYADEHRAELFAPAPPDTHGN